MKTNDLPNNHLSFCLCKSIRGKTYNETATETTYSLLSTKVAANQTK